MTGALSVTFNAAPANAAPVTAAYTNQPVTVLDVETDTDAIGAVEQVVHGMVRRAVLKVGKTDKAAPGTAVLRRLAKRGVYAV